MLISTLIFGCDQPVEPLSGDAALPLGKAAQQSEEVFTVEPTGGDDTENIKAAISAAQAAGDGSVIYFASGHFQTDYLILTDFVGTIRGAGMDQTTLSSLPKIDFGEGPFEYVNPTYENPWPNFINIVGGEVAITDMTISIQEWEPVIPYEIFGYMEKGFFAMIRLTGEETSTHFVRVHFKGNKEKFEQTGIPTANCGLYYSGETYGTPENRMAMSGQHVIESCIFENTLIGLGCMLNSSKFILGGNANSGNVFKHSPMGAFINSILETAVEVSHNKFDCTWMSLRIWQGYTNEAHDDVEDPKIPYEGYVHAKHNTIKISGLGHAVYVRDMVRTDQVKRLSVLVEKNTIISESPYAAMIVDGCFGGTVKNNMFQGSGNGAIFAFSQTKDMLFLGNNLNQFESTSSPYYFGSETSNNTVVGGNLKETVIDNGTDNKIVGVNTQQGSPPGPSIHEAMQEAKELRTYLRR